MEELLIVSVASAALMTASHYALPRLLRREDPHFLERVVVGVGLGILLPLAALDWLNGGCLAWADVATVCAFAGAGTGFAYWLDKP